MTFRIGTAGVWRCDTQHCGEKIVGYLEDGAPEGWIVEEPQMTHDGKPILAFLRHRCAACVTKVFLDSSKSSTTLGT